MEKKQAEDIQSLALSAIRDLHAVVKLPLDWKDPNGLQLKRAIGLIIASIELDVLRVIYAEFPELDDLKEWE